MMNDPRTSQRRTSARRTRADRSEASAAFRCPREAQPLVIAVLILITVGTLVGALGAGDLAIDDVMHQDPRLPIPPVSTVFSPRLEPLWLEALARPAAETRRLAAGTIAVAVGRGMKGLETTVNPLRATLRSDTDRLVRQAAAQALVTLGARAAAADLAAVSEKDGLLMAQTVEPALARWNYQPFRSRWLGRLQDPAVERSLRLLAIDALGTVREEQAVEPLQAVTRQRDLDPPFRLAAARALGNIRAAGLVEFATDLCGGGRSPAAFERLLAALLLVNHRDPQAIELLKKLAVDADPVVARPALERLHALDQTIARPLARQALPSPDAALRAVAVSVVTAQQDADAIHLLGTHLADRNPGIRRFVAAKFAEFGARQELKPIVLEESQAALAEEPWRGLEQAALILGTLDHKPAAPRLTHLLVHARPEVAVSSAWALRRLGIRETLPPLLDHATAVHAQLNQGSAPPHASRQLSQLFQFFGQARYRDAESLLRKFVPKSSLDSTARMSACWALGHLYENQPENDLAAVFAERLADTTSLLPEVSEVRLMTAVGLGRMRARNQLAVLRKYADSDSVYSPAGAACYWSIEQITGEKPPTALPRVFGESGWFLEPTSD